MSLRDYIFREIEPGESESRVIKIGKQRERERFVVGTWDAEEEPQVLSEENFEGI